MQFGAYWRVTSGENLRVYFWIYLGVCLECISESKVKQAECMPSSATVNILVSILRIVLESGVGGLCWYNPSGCTRECTNKYP